MLIISRHEGEAVTIRTTGADVIHVKILRDGAAVRLGIQADKETLILRDELIHQTQTRSTDHARAPTTAHRPRGAHRSL